MPTKSIGTTLLAAALLAIGLAGMAAFWMVVPRTANTSPLAALFTLTFGCTYLVAGILTWRRSRFAALAFLAAVALLLFPAAFIIPGRQILLPSFVVILLVAFLGYRYLHRTRLPAA